MHDVARAAGLTSARFTVVDPDYYNWPLEQRQHHIGAGSVDELCKTVAMENTHLSGAGGEGASASGGRVSRVLVLVQYVAKLHKDKLNKAVRQMEVARGLPALGKRQYNLRLLDSEESARLTGFEHNAVTPLGTQLPIILSDRIAALPSGNFWLGGGHVDVKLNLSVAEARGNLGAFVADVTA